MNFPLRNIEMKFVFLLFFVIDYIDMSASTKTLLRISIPYNSSVLLLTP